MNDTIQDSLNNAITSILEQDKRRHPYSRIELMISIPSSQVFQGLYISQSPFFKRRGADLIAQADCRVRLIRRQRLAAWLKPFVCDDGFGGGFIYLKRFGEYVHCPPVSPGVVAGSGRRSSSDTENE
jgi:hypothetical protein